MPVVEQLVRQQKQTIAGRDTTTAPVDHRLKIATQVRPADLPPPRHDPLSAEPVAADDLTIFAPQEGPGDVATAALGDGEDGEQGGDRRPQPDLLEPLPPRRLVDVRRLGVVDRDRQFVGGGFEDGGRLPLQLGDHPGGDREREHVGGDLADLPLAEPIGPREHRQYGPEVGAEAPGGHALWQFAAGRRATGGTAQAVEPILVNDRLDPGQFGDLMDQGFGVVAGEFMTTAAAGVRLALEGLADLLGWYQGSPCLAMSRLPTAFLLAGRGRGSPLHPDRVGRGGLGRVGGVELEPRFQVEDSSFEIGDPLLHSTEHCRDRRLGVGRNLVPELIRDRKRV